MSSLWRMVLVLAFGASVGVGCGSAGGAKDSAGTGGSGGEAGAMTDAGTSGADGGADASDAAADAPATSCPASRPAFGATCAGTTLSCQYGQTSCCGYPSSEVTCTCSYGFFDCRQTVECNFICPDAGTQGQ